MTKKELKKQIQDLNNILIECIEHSPNIASELIKIAKINKTIKFEFEKRTAIREIKKRNLIDEFIKTRDSFDIQEALKISKKEARKRLKVFDFTKDEKNEIVYKFRGGIISFLEKFNGGVEN